MSNNITAHKNCTFKLCCNLLLGINFTWLKLGLFNFEFNVKMIMRFKKQKQKLIFSIIS